MRARFKHFLPISESEMASIWTNAIVTFDTNVLLDLYRYHQSTRDALLATIEKFRGRLWLTHQAGEEFFRNRAGVIVGASKEFNDADATILDVQKATGTACDQLRGNRAIAGALVDAFAGDVTKAIDTAREAVAKAKGEHPDYLKDDPILEKLLELFDGAVGTAPTDSERVQLQKEAERRAKEKIPPGYRDSAKDGERPHGDYILWAQVLGRAKEKSSPVILVTSERKDDWWEKLSGRRVGPRRELIEEAARVAGQRVLLCEREQFVREASRRFNVTVSLSVLSEIRAVERTRSAATPRSDANLTELIEQVLEKAAIDLMDSDEQITSCIAETNASGYYPDTIDVKSAGPLNLGDAMLPFEATIHFSGEQDPDHMFYGDTITAEISGTLSFNGTEWEMIDYELTAEVDDYRDDADEESP